MKPDRQRSKGGAYPVPRSLDLCFTGSPGYPTVHPSIALSLLGNAESQPQGGRHDVRQGLTCVKD